MPDARSEQVGAGHPDMATYDRQMTFTTHNNTLDLLLDSLGITTDILSGLRMPAYRDAGEVILAETASDGKRHLLIPEAALAWREMKHAAHRDGVIVDIVSAFRDVHEQADIIREKLRRGMPMTTILTLSAPPGYSEHHTGCAVDINTPGCEPREEPFEHTEAFGWLARHAHRFRFSMSYPRGNALGFIYEPWHWRYRPVMPAG